MLNRRSQAIDSKPTKANSHMNRLKSKIKKEELESYLQKPLTRPYSAKKKDN